MLKLIVLNLALFIIPEKLLAQTKAFASASVNIISAAAGIETLDSLTKETTVYYNDDFVLSNSKTAYVLSEKKFAEAGEKLVISVFTIIGGSSVYDISIPTTQTRLRRKKGEGGLKATSFAIGPNYGSLSGSDHRSEVLTTVLKAEGQLLRGHYTNQEPVELVVNFN